VSARARQILGRFPAHLEADRPGKLLGAVVTGLAHDLDVQAARMAGIRRAHRLGEADELGDLLRLAALHGITRAELAELFLRFDHAHALLAALEQASEGGDEAERDQLAENFVDLWGVEEPAPRLPLYAPAGGPEPDLAAAAQRLVAHAREALRHRALLDAVRTRVATICSIHPGGNGTVRALMTGAANALDLDLGDIAHSEDRFWHAAIVRDRLRLSRPVLETTPAGVREVARPFTPREEILAVEENPLRRDQTDARGRRHGELFSVLRRGFDRAILQIRITGDGEHTVGPMIVNRDEGHGVGITGAVPAGSTLVLTEQGRALLDGSDVTSRAYAWQGACFAGSDAQASRDFVFDGAGVDPARVARFAVATPDGALDREALFPHSGMSLPMPGILVGETRLAFFVQQAHLSARIPGSPEDEPEDDLEIRRVTPRPGIAFAGGSVFAAGPGESLPIAAQVALSWLEHRAFTARLLLPARFRALEDAGAPIAERVRQAVERFRPAGVAIEVVYVDDRWVLGEGVLTAGEVDDPIARLRSAVVLWPTAVSISPAPAPTPVGGT
jgi:hypothetical protein